MPAQATGSAAMELESSGPDSPAAKRNARMARYSLLATPKQSKATWWTSFGPDLVWGNQEPMWTLKRSSLTAVASPRLEHLARPKIDHRPPDNFIPEFQYSCGRTSQIWKVSLNAMKATSSQRVAQLSRHKTAPPDYLEHRPQFAYSCGRSSQIWTTSKAAMSCRPRPHTAGLARSKQTHTDYHPSRQHWMYCITRTREGDAIHSVLQEVQTIVSNAAKTCMPSEHTEQLAKPKERPDGPFRDPEWKISPVTMQATATDRVMELSKPKKLADGYQPCRDVIWKVGMGARTAVASNRMEELAKPIVRDTMDHVQFNPDAFNVSVAAKTAKASARIEELAQPSTRGTH